MENYDDFSLQKILLETKESSLISLNMISPCKKCSNCMISNHLEVDLHWIVIFCGARDVFARMLIMRRNICDYCGRSARSYFVPLSDETVFSQPASCDGPGPTPLNNCIQSIRALSTKVIHP